MLKHSLLKTFLSLPKQEIVELFTKTFGSPTYSGGHFWLWYEPDRPLLVAHIDTVQQEQEPEDLGQGLWKTFGTADDRAGVYSIYEIAREYGDVSILLTDLEESGGIGAREFCEVASKEKLNFLYAIEYDRRGFADWIDYNNVNHEDFNAVFEKYYRQATGSYSDVSTIQLELGISAVNISTGYENNHSKKELLFLPVIERNLELFPIIRKELKEVQYKAKEKEYVYDWGWYRYRYGYGYGGYGYRYGGYGYGYRYGYEYDYEDMDLVKEKWYEDMVVGRGKEEEENLSVYGYTYAEEDKRKEDYEVCYDKDRDIIYLYNDEEFIEMSREDFLDKRISLPKRIRKKISKILFEHRKERKQRPKH